MKTLNKSALLVILLASAVAFAYTAIGVNAISGGTGYIGPASTGVVNTVTSTSKFNLKVGQTFVSDYLNMTILLNSLTGTTANITVNAAGGCGTNADPGCLGMPAFQHEFDLNLGGSQNLLGASLKFVQVVSGNEAVFILTTPGSEVSSTPRIIPPTPIISIHPTPTPNPRPTITPTPTPRPTPPIIIHQTISVEQPARFTLQLNQTAKVINYRNITITLVSTDFLPCDNGPCPLNLLPAKAQATILAGTPGMCLFPVRSGDTNPPECRKTYNIGLDSLLNVNGLSISLLGVNETEANFYITANERIIPPTPTPRPSPLLTPPPSSSPAITPSAPVNRVTEIKQIEKDFYQIKGKQKGKLLFLFPVEVNVSYSIKNGATTNVDKSWWNFLVW